MSSNLAKILNEKKKQKKSGSISPAETKLLERLYTSGKAAYGSIKSLKNASNLSHQKVATFLQQKDAHTKYHQVKRNFPRLKVIAYDLDEIWSMDVAYVDKLAKYNNGVKYLLVAVDVLSRYLRVSPMKTKSAEETARTFKRMIGKRRPQKIWTDKGTEFKGAFKQLCDREGIDSYTTHSETKSAYAERNIRSLKNIIYKYLEHKWTYRYINKLSSFVDTINSRVNRVTRLAPKKVTKKHVPYLRALAAEKSKQFIKKPQFKVGDTVRIAKQNLPFNKGYKQNFTDEIFTITQVATLNPPTYSLTDRDHEVINGKFYGPELIRANGRI